MFPLPGILPDSIGGCSKHFVLAALCLTASSLPITSLAAKIITAPYILRAYRIRGYGTMRKQYLKSGIAADILDSGSAQDAGVRPAPFPGASR